MNDAGHIILSDSSIDSDSEDEDWIPRNSYLDNEVSDVDNGMFRNSIVNIIVNNLIVCE